MDLEIHELLSLFKNNLRQTIQSTANFQSA